MADWRETYMLQASPQKLGKIDKCILNIKAVLKPEYSLLDVGCGQGFFYPKLEHENYLGIDLNESEIEQAKRNHPAGRFEVGDLFDLKGEWDVVVCSRVLIHVAPLDVAMEKLLAAAKKYLCLVVHVGNKDEVTEYVNRPTGRFYFRVIDRSTLNKYGKCSIHEDGHHYSAVIYSKDD